MMMNLTSISNGICGQGEVEEGEEVISFCDVDDNQTEEAGKESEAADIAWLFHSHLSLDPPVRDSNSECDHVSSWLGYPDVSGPLDRTGVHWWFATAVGLEATDFGFDFCFSHPSALLFPWEKSAETV